MTSQDPYLRQHEARYAPDELTDPKYASTRRSPGSALGLAVALAIAVAIVAVLSLGPAATTDPVDTPVAADPDGAPVPMTVAPDAPVQDVTPEGGAVPAAPDGAPVE
ncbi:hypothetical protein [Antarctobacter heliothermus]|uniref:Uncharacterized protein n=1 Tax=Antarctobacter heliothermus TaxID=74033 RepID=A0A239J3D8_9RHOB|nr:hypothetical protein [Antarctobacter heliothermus]SNS99783.1 hypothetical protein SAMN04488078_10488 [Antarctobacter heliothermus]